MPVAASKKSAPPPVLIIRPFTAIFPAAAFAIPGGFDIRIDLLDRLENEFANWSEKLVPANSVPDFLPVSIREASFVFTILHSQCDAQIRLANQIFLDAAKALDELNLAQGGGCAISCDALSISGGRRRESGANEQKNTANAKIQERERGGGLVGQQDGARLCEAQIR